MAEHIRPKIDPDTAEILEDIKDEFGYADLDAAIRHVLRDQGYDV